VPTPGDNEKNYLAGSLNWRSGAMLAPGVLGRHRDGKLVAKHLEELCHRLRCYRRIHVVWDNAKIHKCTVVNEVLRRHGARLQVHFIPLYAPKCNPAERIWWHLREEITRNHRCQNLGELVDLTLRWLNGRYFVVEDSVYRESVSTTAKKKAA
jgi:hypothetical protein